MKIVIRPIVDPQREIDLTNRLVSAIAEELWRLYGGNDHLNWLEAERHLERIVGEAQHEAAEAVFVSVAPAAAGAAGHEPVVCPSCPRRTSRGGRGDRAGRSSLAGRRVAREQHEPAIAACV
jgi:hypothetical protein